MTTILYIKIKKMEYLLRPCTPVDLEKLMILIAKHAEFEKAVYSSADKKGCLELALFGENSTSV